MRLSKLEQNILRTLDQTKKPLKTKDLASVLKMKGNRSYKKLIKAVAFLERVGEIECLDNGTLRKLQSNQEVEGIYRANAKGFGFINYDENSPDLFVPAGKNYSAMDGDFVKARILRHVNPQTGKGSEAEVVDILERSTNQLVGEFITYDQDEREKTGYTGFLIPKDSRLGLTKVNILPEGIQPVDHTICIVKIKDYPTKKQPKEATGYVAKEIGHRDEPGVDILSILYQFGIPHQFPQNVLDEAEQIPQEVSLEEIKGRVDLRDELVMTIDGADAKDLDDAISLHKLNDNSYRLKVHIADVSHYVTEGSALDAEARERGTSVYLTDRVVPMLPQRLSNGICSLHPHEDRLTLTCDMKINAKGRVTSHQIYESVINSKYRMTYKDVNAIIDDHDETLRQEYEEIVPMLDEMKELHKILEAMRIKRGALNFDAPEAYIKVDEEGHPVDIQVRERHTGERLIESFMLVANETVAEEFMRKDLPFVYRIHEQPEADKMTRFAEFITAFGLILKGNIETISPKQVQQILTQIEGEPYERVVSSVLLRSMQQAKYDPTPQGHYGLAATDYTHFTSPIRRYPDLMVHRLIHSYLKGRPSQKELNRFADQLPGITEHSSNMERRAIEAERETDALKKAEYMVERIGEEYEGIISSVTSFGMFVELPNTVEGLVTTVSLQDDFYIFNPNHLMLIGERTGKVYQIGQRVRIKVTHVDVEERQIDFELLEAEPVDHVPQDALVLVERKRRRNQRRKGKHNNKDSFNPSKHQFKVKRRKNN